MRTAFDFSPLYRSTVGFDRLFDLLDQAHRLEAVPNWPPYNIERVAEDQYRITMAVAGFSSDEIEMIHHQNALIVSGHKNGTEDSSQYLHRGIAARPFKQTFNLADHVKVTGATLENGLLTVELKREIPEQLRPRRIEIGSSTGQKPVGQDNQPQTIDHEPQQSRVA